MKILLILTELLNPQFLNGRGTFIYLSNLELVNDSTESGLYYFEIPSKELEICCFNFIYLYMYLHKEICFFYRKGFILRHFPNCEYSRWIELVF